jgi:hypothetical protein
MAKTPKTDESDQKGSFMAQEVGPANFTEQSVPRIDSRLSEADLTQNRPPVTLAFARRRGGP